MEYLHKRQVYVDRYDLHTIEFCLLILKSRKKMLEHEPLKKRQTKEEHAHEVDKAISHILYWQKAEDYQKKEERIKKWMTEDKRVQHRYDTATPPNIKCEHCGKKLKENHRTFNGSDYQTSLISFILICEDCRNIKQVYKNGSEVEPPPPEKCTKCNTEVKVDWRFDKHITTREYTCAKCGNHEKTVDDDTQFWIDFEKKEEHDKELLLKYRDEFCLNEKDGEEAVKVIEHHKLAQEVYEYELSKFEDPAKTLSYHAKKLDTNELEKLLNTSLIPLGYKGLTFGKVDIDRYVIIPFTIQETDTKRKGNDSIRFLTEKMKSLLENTNWRLMKDDLMYRLGYLSGRLKGYEREDDLLTLFDTKTPTRKVPEIDPERMEKYGYGGRGMVGLARIAAEHDGRERIRAKKLVDNPDGYFLQDSDGNGYSCGICRKSMRGSETWWDLNGLRCEDCQRNIKAGVIPVSLLKDYDEWFSLSDTWYMYKIRSNTVQKMVRDNLLVARDLKDEHGKIYCTVLLKDENEEFLKTHPAKTYSLPVVMKDSEGREFTL